MSRTHRRATLAIGLGGLLVAAGWSPLIVLAQNTQPGPVIDLAGEWVAGKSPEQIKAAKVTLEYDGLYAVPAYAGEMFVEAVYNDLRKGR